MKATLRNKVSLIGNLGSNPVVKEMTGGRKYVRLSIATRDNYKPKEGEKEPEPQWHTIVAWGTHADYAEKFLKKGSFLAVEGRLVTRVYLDREEHKKWITEVVVTEFMNLSFRQSEAA